MLRSELVGFLEVIPPMKLDASATSISGIGSVKHFLW